jgi:hypothetical protein
LGAGEHGGGTESASENRGIRVRAPEPGNHFPRPNPQLQSFIAMSLAGEKERGKMGSGRVARTSLACWALCIALLSMPTTARGAQVTGQLEPSAMTLIGGAPEGTKVVGGCSKPGTPVFSAVGPISVSPPKHYGTGKEFVMVRGGMPGQAELPIHYRGDDGDHRGAADVSVRRKGLHAQRRAGGDRCGRLYRGAAICLSEHARASQRQRVATRFLDAGPGNVDGSPARAH